MRVLWVFIGIAVVALVTALAVRRRIKSRLPIPAPRDEVGEARRTAQADAAAAAIERQAAQAQIAALEAAAPDRAAAAVEKLRADLPADPGARARTVGDILRAKVEGGGD